jgi:hypothetical protein
VAGLGGVVVYGLCAWALKSPEARFFFSAVRERLDKKSRIAEVVIEK